MDARIRRWRDRGNRAGACATSAPAATDAGRPSARDVDLLAEHLGRDQRDATLAHMKALAILLGIEAGGEAFGQDAAAIDHTAAQPGLTMDLHVRQDHRI